MKTLLFTLATVASIIIASCSNESSTENTIKNDDGATVELIQFHSEHRCVTCQKIEDYAKETLKTFPDIPFRLINADDPTNEAICEQFEAAGTALFLYNHETGEKLDLTEFAFMEASNQDKFMSGLGEHIRSFAK